MDDGLGRELKRMSSFERLMMSSSSVIDTNPDLLSECELHALTFMQSWWKKKNKLLKARSNMLKASIQADVLLQTIKSFGSNDDAYGDEMTFEEGQKKVSNPTLINALSFFLSCLPKDPSIKVNNVSFSRIIISSIMIWRFPDVVLTSSSPIEDKRMKTKTRARMRTESESDVSESDNDDDKKKANMDDEYEKDDSIEAMNCLSTANFLINGLKKLLAFAITGTGKLKSFHQVLLSFRYEARLFMHALERWKILDQVRMLQSLEIAYMQTYAMVIAAREKASETGNNERDLCLVKAAENQLDKMHRSLLSIVGDSTHGNHIAEELRAQVEAAVTNKSNSNNVNAITVVQTVPIIDVGDKENEMDQSQMKLLERISKIAGLGNEKLAHELFFNPSWHLPEVKLPTFESMISGQIDSSDLHEKMKNQLLRLIGDRLIWSLKSSSIVSPEDVQEGQIVPIEYELWGCLTHLSAKILKIENENDRKVLEVQYVYDEVKEKSVDISRVKLLSSSPNPLPLVTAIIELKERIQSLMPRRPDLQEAAFHGLDLELLSQMIRHSALNTDDLLNYLLPMLLTITSLQAPIRAEVTNVWLQSFLNKCRSAATIDEVFEYLPYFFEFSTACIDEVLRDMANYYIANLVPIMQKEGPAFLRSKFVKQLNEGSVSLTNTFSTIHNVASNFGTIRVDIDEALGLGQDTKFSLPLATNSSTGQVLTLSGKSIIAKYFLQILQVSQRLDSREGLQTLPEVFGWDASRLAKFRDDIDIIALELTIIIVLKQTIARYNITLSEDDEIEFQTRLDVILREPDVRTPLIVTEAFRTAKNNAEKFKGKIINYVHLEEDIEKALKNVINLENPVYILFSKRIFKVILKAILKQPYVGSLKAFSLNGKIQEKNVGNIIKAISTYFDRHLNIYEKIYAALLSDDELLKLFN